MISLSLKVFPLCNGILKQYSTAPLRMQQEKKNPALRARALWGNRAAKEPTWGCGDLWRQRAGKKMKISAFYPKISAFFCAKIRDNG